MNAVMNVKFSGQFFRLTSLEITAVFDRRWSRWIIVPMLTCWI